MGKSIRLPRRSLLTAGAATLLSGCASDRRQTLTFHQSKPEAIPFFREEARRYTAAQDRVSIKHDVTANLSAAFVRNYPPNIGLKNYNFEMARFMERGALSDLGDMPEAARIKPDVRTLLDQFPGYRDRFSVLPYSVIAASTIYNRQIFRNHDLEIPSTWSELMVVCKKLTTAGITPFYATFAEPWTISQAWFDYAVGGMIDVAAFYRRMNDMGSEVSPQGATSFTMTLREPVERMRMLMRYTNTDAASRSYGDGNTAMAHGKAAMYLQGPWALGEIAKTGTNLEFGSFPLPMTDNPSDRKVRVHIDLGLWIPEGSDHQDLSREFAHHLMTPEVQYRYNATQLGFNTTIGGPPVDDPRIVEMQRYYDEGKFYQGASQFIPLTIPTVNYLQSIALGADVASTLTKLDNDWARLASRR